MSEMCTGCPLEAVHAVEMKALNNSLTDLKDRVTRLESTMARGMMLLVANLVGVIVTLAQGLLAS